MLGNTTFNSHSKIAVITKAISGTALPENTKSAIAERMAASMKLIMGKMVVSKK